VQFYWPTKGMDRKTIASATAEEVAEKIRTWREELRNRKSVKKLP